MTEKRILITSVSPASGTVPGKYSYNNCNDYYLLSIYCMPGTVCWALGGLFHLIFVVEAVIPFLEWEHCRKTSLSCPLGIGSAEENCLGQRHTSFQGNLHPVTDIPRAIRAPLPFWSISGQGSSLALAAPERPLGLAAALFGRASQLNSLLYPFLLAALPFTGLQ